MGVFQNLPTCEKGVLELKITKKHIYIYLKRRIFSGCTGRNVGSLGAAKAKNGGGGGLSGAHTRTVPIWEYHSPSQPPPPRGTVSAIFNDKYIELLN